MSSTQQLLLGEGAGGSIPNYIEDVFQTWLYSGNSSTQTITNGIDLSTKGGMVWTKSRNATYDNTVYDTARGTGNNKALYTNTTNAQGAFTGYQDLTAYNTDGYSIGSPILLNETGKNYVSWTFRKQPKFFDVVTYTGDGTSNRAVAHNLGSVPGFMIVKVTSESNNWTCWHRSITGKILELNTTAAQANDSGGGYFYSSPDATNIYLGSDWQVNKTDATYVAYLFAHNAGGFGLTGTDNVISCGSASATGVTAVSLGYEPQFCMLKKSSGIGGWFMTDTMRGWNMQGDVDVRANVADAETDRTGSGWFPSATGFTFDSAQLNGSGDYIYIAIRRGPMKVPTSGTSVFSPLTRTGTGANATISGIPFAPDAIISTSRGVGAKGWMDKLRGVSTYLRSNLTDAQGTNANIVLSYTNTGVNVGPDTTVGLINYPAFNFISYFLQRAPSFFDEVCYTGTGVTNRTVTHNLTVAPQLLFVKSRSNTQAWSALCTLNSGLQGRLNATDALSAPSAAVFGNGTSYVAPTASVFTVGTDNETNASTWTYVAYLFATCAGVSKVGSYTGTGTTLQIDCGFTGGARFVMIKRSNSTGDWYFWDSARGIIAGNDPYLLMNSNATEVTNTDYVDTYSAGFEISSTAPAAINASGGTFIFLAIA